MRARAVLLALAVLLAGCARATLPYRPDPQPRGARLSAGYHVVGDRVGIELDTDGRRLEQAWIMKPGGQSVAPVAVDMPPIELAPSSSVSVGVGGGTWGGGGGFGVGTGLGVGIPVGGRTDRVRGTTLVWFPRDAAGPPPWQVYVKVVGVEPATFGVGGPLPAQ
jgi:hypothetical protein